MIKIGKILVFVSSLILVSLIISLFFSRELTFYDSEGVILSFISLVFYLVGFILMLIKGDNSIKKGTKSTAGIIGLTLGCIALVYKYFHYPLSGIFIIIAIMILALIYAPLNFKDKYQKWKLFTRSSRDAFLLCLFDFLGVVIILFAIMFKLQHWPAAGTLSIFGIIVLAISIFAWNQKFKKEVVFRKKAEEKLNETLHEVKIQKQEIEEKNEELSQQNEEISTQRDQLSERNNSINESILYAKRIQTAVLPSQAYIDVILPENFILFKPRDKVSGDFYWVRQISDFIVITAADCTGHGVPGAIMSMLGLSFFNEIVQKREITQPSQALNELRKQIKQALRQTGKKGEADDGMDIALCALDTKTNMLQYSGANNSLYLIQNGAFNEIKADKMPIGYYPNEKPSFTNHEIQLKDGDIFYLFSDGFMDQFGGKKGFKYKASNFQKILLENHNKPMVIQKELLEQELKSWMKGYEQTDDILVMGVRV